MAALGAGAARREAAFCGDSSAGVWRQLRFPNEISGTWRAAQQTTRQLGQTPRPVKPVHPCAVRHISTRAAVVLLSKPKPQLNDKQKEMVTILKRRCPGFGTMRHLV